MITTMRKIFAFPLLLFLLISISTNVNAQRRVDEVDPYREFLNELSEYRKLCRNALKPYRYDGAKTTHFSYKEYNYRKEVEIGTVQDSEYRLSFNSNGIKYDQIKVEIYDKPSKFKARVLLYEKDGVGGNEFTVETGPMLEKLKEVKREKGVDEEIIERMRLKKLYISYVIPAIDREIEVDPETGNEVKVVTKGAIVLALGYSNI
ncbi:MAG: hypothetical protein CL853_06610 [Crocinitomicaceae bacterium]|nr:hypothetical protein [Crocinitomicaceae bacterium]